VLRIRKDKWDNSHVWAPSIVKRNGLWYMFYTGVTSIPNQFNYHQRTGVAVSADLWNWQRFDAPVWACSNVPWVYCNPLTIDGGDFRDPCVIPEPGQPGSWLMYYACRPAVAQDQMMISVARSTDLMNWANVKPLWNTTQYRTFSPLIESPELLERNGLWYLFYTTNSGHALSYQMSSDPLADSTGWSAQFRLSQEIPEVSTDPWFGIEFFRDAGHDYLLAANGGLRCIEIHEVVWDDPPHFHLIEPTAYGMTAGAPLPPVGGALALERIASGGVSAARFRITLPAASDARLDVIDLQGRPVHTLIAAPLLSGSTEVAWDGAGRDGRTAPTGIYFARLSSGSEQRTLKFARVR
jgi:hypothetical protein